MVRFINYIFALFILSFGAPKTYSTTIWESNFEDNSLNQWSYLLNQQGIYISQEHSREGVRAAKVVIKGTSDYLWNNNPKLNRVEMQYQPKTTQEGKDTFLNWSFMLPKLFTNQRHEFAYWESSKSYQQMLRFNLAGKKISFVNTQNSKVYWQYSELTTQQWYDMTIHIHWSSDANKGYVSLWFNGEFVLNKVSMQTLFSADEPMFIQLGILRDQNDLIETIWLDRISETSSIAPQADSYNR